MWIICSFVLCTALLFDPVRPWYPSRAKKEVLDRRGQIFKIRRIKEQCPEGEVIGEIYSEQFKIKDREWSVGCIRNSKAWQDLPESSEVCQWSSWANVYKRPLDFSCHGDGFIRGWQSYFSRKAGDRRNKFECCSKPGIEVACGECKTSGYINGYHGELHYVVPNDHYLVGVRSYYSSHYSDRKWTFQTCKQKTKDVATKPAKGTVLYKHIGCYNDKRNRALPEMLGRVSTVQECYKLTKAKAYSAFGVQYGGECWSSEDAVERYDRYGKGRTCSNGMGGRWTQNVYIITGLTAYLTADDFANVFVDGKLVTNPRNNGHWNLPQRYTLDSGVKTIAVEVHNSGGPGGLLASFNNGKMTDASWKCSARRPALDWFAPEYDDSAMPAAVVYKCSHGISGIAPGAKWIGPKNRMAKFMYCRLKLDSN